MAVERLPRRVRGVAFGDGWREFAEQEGAKGIAAAGRVFGIETLQRRTRDRAGKILHPARVVDLLARMADADDDHLVEIAVTEHLDAQIGRASCRERVCQSV